MSVREIAGKAIEFDDEGFMIDYTVWNEEIAAEIAKEQGLTPMTDLHWQVITFCRANYKETGEVPTLRRITKVGGVPTKQLYKLFPKGPAKKVARIAGLTKPTGCI